MADAIIFDFDGTLVESVDSIYKEFARVSEKLSLGPLTRERFNTAVGLIWDDVLDSLWPGIDKDRFNSEYRTSAEKAKPVEGIFDLLDELSQDHILAIMTSRGQASTDSIIDNIGLNRSIFASVYTKDNMTFHKPDPRALKKVCEKLSVSPGDALYVGDAVADMQCASDAGCPACGVLTGGTSEKALYSAGADVVIPSVMGLFKVLKDIGD